MRLHLHRFFVLFSIIILSVTGYLVWQRQIPIQLEASSITQSTYAPTILRIPEAHIELPIIPSQLKDGKWEATDRGVSYLTDSPVPGEYGNSILYGHDWPSLLGPLKKMKKGQKIDISYSDGSTKSFSVVGTSVVTPSQTYIMYPTDDKRLTIYTCDGFLDSKRFVVTAI